MDRHELNEIIGREHKYPVYVNELVYGEVEEMYVRSYYDIGKGIEKSGIGTFYQKFDYQGVRNALEIINHYEEFKNEVITNVTNGKNTLVAPSQLEYLRLIGWETEKLNLLPEYPWVSAAEQEVQTAAPMSADIPTEQPQRKEAQAMTMQEKIREYREFQRMKEEVEATLDALKLEIITDMDGEEEVVAGEYKVRNKTVTSSRVDTTALKKTLPDIAARFMLTSTSKRFSVA